MTVHNHTEHSTDVRRDTVDIMINGVEFEIHRGRRTVAEIKEVGDVLRADELEQIVDGKLIPLDDDGAVTVKGGEQFVSHPRDSAAA